MPSSAPAQGGTPSAAGPASGPASGKPVSLADLAVYEGADRLQLLTEGAKKEGSLTVYTSRTQEDIDKIKSPYFADLIPQAIPSHGEWVAISLNLFCTRLQ